MDTKWAANDVSNGKYIGVLEFQEKEEWHDFEVLQVNNRLVFGGACNAGFLESGYMDIDDSESLDEALSELQSELEVYYLDGKQYAPRLVCNERM